MCVMSLEGALTLTQGAYFTITGLWPLFSIRTFQLVTGPKTDKWLVQMVGLLAASIGIPLLYFAIMGGVHPHLAWVAVLSAISFLAIDVFYFKRGVIGKIYLLDAVIEALFLIAWAVVFAT